MSWKNGMGPLSEEERRLLREMPPDGKILWSGDLPWVDDGGRDWRMAVRVVCTKDGVLGELVGSFFGNGGVCVVRAPDFIEREILRAALRALTI